MTQRSAFSCQSAGPDMAQYHKISVGGGSGGGVGSVGGGTFYREDMRMGGFQRSMRPRSCIEQDTLSMHAMGQHPAQGTAWMVDGSDAASMVSDRDATFSRQYAQNTVNGYATQVRQGGTMTFQSPMRRSLSGTLSGMGGMPAGDVEIVHQQSFKGPAQRTISRMANRNKMSMSSMSGTVQRQMSSSGSAYGSGVDVVDRGFIAPGLASASQGSMMMRQSTLPRTMSMKSMHSVGRGMDIYGQQLEMGASMGNLSG